VSTGYCDRPVARAIKIKHAGLNLTGRKKFQASSSKLQAASVMGIRGVPLDKQQAASAMGISRGVPLDKQQAMG